MHVPLVGGGVTVRPNVTGAIAAGGARADGVVVDVTVVVANNATTPASAVVVALTVVDAAGAIVGTGSASLPAIAPGAQTEARATVALVGQTALWAPAHPSLYSLRTVVTVSGAPADDATTAFGVRVVEFDVATGLRLNGVPTKIKGFCQHDNGRGWGWGGGR